MVGQLHSKEIPHGYCHCGCGQKTKIAKKTNTKSGWIAGEPRFYVHGHHIGSRENHRYWNGGQFEYTNRDKKYRMILCPDHPNHQRKYVQEHILVAEKALGKCLPVSAIVHHVDGNGLNNANDNLVVCNDNAYHKLLHKRANAYNACGHANWPKCQFCKQYDDPKNLKFYGLNVCHQECNTKYQKDRREVLCRIHP